MGGSHVRYTDLWRRQDRRVSLSSTGGHTPLARWARDERRTRVTSYSRELVRPRRRWPIAVRREGVVPRLHVADIMATHVQTIDVSESAEHAWHLMRQCDIHHLVVMRGGAVAGVLSARDLGGSRGESIRTGHRVVDLMVRSVATAQPHSTVRQAAALMRGRSIGCLPVVSRGELVGIVTSSDLLELIANGVESPSRNYQRPPARPLHKPKTLFSPHSHTRA